MIKYILITIILLIILGVGYYLISPLFITVKIDEASPEVEQPKGEPVGSVVEEKKESTEVQKETNEKPQTKVASAQVIGTTGHPASGTVRIIEADGKQYIRYENFKTINGPDIYVYLSKDLDAKEFVSLGRVKGTEGNINYEIPADINVADYTYVMTWCKAFGVLFNYANVSEMI